MPELVVAGAGMAGLVAAARARELGATVTLLEKGDRPGGSFRYSSGFVWRYREWDTFRAQMPLNALLQPEMHGRYMQAVLAAYEQCGWLPSWHCGG